MKHLLLIPDWDFDWQEGYAYKQPFVLPKGTVVKAEFIWDNTADNPRNPHHPPQLITWGEDSTDEMSGLVIGGVTVSGGEEIFMWGAAIGHYFEIEKKANEAKEIRKKSEAK